MDLTTQLAIALKELANAQRAASALWDEMESTMSIDELERALEACGYRDGSLMPVEPGEHATLASEADWAYVGNTSYRSDGI